MSRIAKQYVMVTACTVLGLGLGFLANLLMAAKFGVGLEMDVYQAAIALPTVIASIATASLQYTFIPVFAEYRAKNDDALLWKVVSSFLNVSAVASIVIAVVGMIFSDSVVSFLTPGFTGVKLVRSAELLRYLFPTTALSVVGEILASVYYSQRRMLLPSLNRFISPLFTLVFLLTLGDTLSVKSLVFGAIAAGIAQVVILFMFINRGGSFRYSLTFDYRSEGVRKIGKLMVPLVVGMSVSRMIPLIDRYFLSQLSEGSIAQLGYAWTIFSALGPVLASGLAISLFPVMAQQAAERDMAALRETMAKGTRMIFFVTMPLLALLTVFGTSFIQLIFERGAFTHADTIAVAGMFTVYLWALPAGSIGSIIGKGFYVLQDTRTVMILGFLEVFSYPVFCLLLLPHFAVFAIPISYVIYFNLSFIIISWIIWRKLGKADGREMKISCLKIAACAIVISLFLWAVLVQGFHVENVYAVNLVVVLGLVLYLLATTFIVRLDEAILIWKEYITRPLRGLGLVD